ncbi:heptaprenyl diphosphate synthase/octaprenyl-diphosphate synthase [Herbihabitans rhizosphaerae]|uniref:Heptaprenyl diphosphate synthase/octaprenyl-diphosphate synthase n=1 Tax=Herbihabitans rhizosphaerae TaxID=1872711 RepID=A0A4V2EU22_9PSEU|nr:polyprenyl synthetase family protein [Herbihabitans rhizosphaerae]RZS43063.1 heptaprenyl diphosphate synthase/octaprenyl-diphosphate synthase [Herbihabitans rhizosphaerae]
MTTEVPEAPLLADFDMAVSGRMRYLVRGMPPTLAPMVHSLIDRPGKRLRSALVHACGEFGRPVPGRIERAGAIVEFLHLASLMHDDVVDKADVRRGAPAAHLVFGTERVVLAGLSCFSLAGMEAADLGDGAAKAVSRAAAGLAYGQVLDLERAFDAAMGIDDYLELIERKTADLFRLCCLLGAAEGRCARPVMTSLIRLGHQLGLAFQVLDDCLDLRDKAADKAEDKPFGTDLVRGLWGAPVLLALADDENGELRSALLSPTLTVADVPHIRALVEQRDGLRLARELAGELLTDATATLHDLPAGSPRDQLAKIVVTLGGV